MALYPMVIGGGSGTLKFISSTTNGSVKSNFTLNADKGSYIVFATNYPDSNTCISGTPTGMTKIGSTMARNRAGAYTILEMWQATADTQVMNPTLINEIIAIYAIE